MSNDKRRSLITYNHITYFLYVISYFTAGLLWIVPIVIALLKPTLVFLCRLCRVCINRPAEADHNRPRGNHSSLDQNFCKRKKRALTSLPTPNMMIIPV